MNSRRLVILDETSPIDDSLIRHGGADATFVSLDAVASARLTALNIPHLDNAQVDPVDFEALHAKDLTHAYSLVRKRLELAFSQWSSVSHRRAFLVDPSFFTYPLKILVDQVAFHLAIINAAVRITDFAEVCLPPPQSLEVNDSHLVSSKSSLFNYCWEQSPKTKNIRSNFQRSSPANPPSFSNTSFGQQNAWRHNYAEFTHQTKRALSKWRLLRGKLRRLIASQSFGYKGTSLSTNNVLRILGHSKEISAARLLAAHSTPNLCYRPVDVSTYRKRLRVEGTRLPPQRQKGLTSKIELFDCDVTGLVDLVINSIVSSLDGIREVADSTLDQIGHFQPDLIVVESLSALSDEATGVFSAAQVAEIPVAVWMHGGYGAYPEFAGYEETDLEFADAHLVYGPETAGALRNYLRLHSPSVSHQVHAVGSAHFTRIYSGHRNKPTKRKKPKIVASLGPRYPRNQFYFGYRRRGVEMGLWRETLQILEKLAQFTQHADVVVKDYPNSELKALWTSECNRLGLAYQTDEVPFDSVLKTADVVILMWVSTTFFESLSAGRPILLWDDGEFTESSKKILQKYGGFSESLQDFISLLDKQIPTQAFRNLDHQFLASKFLTPFSGNDLHHRLTSVVKDLPALQLESGRRPFRSVPDGPERP